MIIRPSRRELLKYGSFLALLSKLKAQSVAFPGPGTFAATASPITVVTHTSGQSVNGTSVVSGSIDTTGANLIVVTVSWDAVGTSPALVDSKLNTWNLVANACPASATGAKVRTYYAYAPTVGSAHTFTFSASTGFPSITVLAFANTVGSTLDQSNCNWNAGAANASQTTGSVTPAHNGEVVVAGFSGNQSGLNTITINSSFIATGTTTNQTGTAVAGASAYIIQTTATAENPTWSWTTNTQGSAQINTWQ